MEGVLIWRIILDAVMDGTDCPMPYLDYRKYKTRKGDVVKIRNIFLSRADDLHILVTMNVKTIKEA